MALNLFALLRVVGLRLKAVAGDPLCGDAFVLRLAAHFVADVVAGTFMRGSAVSAFCDSFTVGCNGCANGCSAPFSLVALLWARHPGEDAKRPFCHFGACNLNCLKTAVGA